MLTAEAKEQIWRNFRRTVEHLGYGEMQRLQIREGVPVRAEEARGSVNFESTEDTNRFIRGRAG